MKICECGDGERMCDFHFEEQRKEYAYLKGVDRVWVLADADKERGGR